MEFLVVINTLGLILAGSVLMYILVSKSRNRTQSQESTEKQLTGRI